MTTKVIDTQEETLKCQNKDHVHLLFLVKKCTLCRACLLITFWILVFIFDYQKTLKKIMVINFWKMSTLCTYLTLFLNLAVQSCTCLRTWTLVITVNIFYGAGNSISYFTLVKIQIKEDIHHVVKPEEAAKNTVVIPTTSSPISDERWPWFSLMSKTLFIDLSLGHRTAFLPMHLLPIG